MPQFPHACAGDCPGDPSQPPPPVSVTLRPPLQVPEAFGPVRTIAEGRGDTLFVGTTRNSVLLGSLAAGFTLLVQVSLIGSPSSQLHRSGPA